MKSKVHFFLLFVISFLGLFQEKLFGDSFLFGEASPSTIVINNRVLARINGKPISVIDIMKKMDILFLKQFPEYTSISEARFQFYDINWKRVLEDLIDKELVLADAEENKVQVSSGDVRQEMETLFGPNIIENLDKIGLTFEEASKIVQGDLTIRRMMMLRVNSKAMRGITPQAVHAAYEDFSQKNIRKEAWHYKVVTIRNKDVAQGKKIADLAYELVTEQGVPLEGLAAKIKEESPLQKSSVTISDDLFHTEEEIAETLKPILQKMSQGIYSKPFEQKSRADNSTIYRIVFLKEKIPGGKVPFNELEMQLHDELFNAALEIETEAYLKKLRHHFDVKENAISELIPEEFQPFALK